MNRNKIILQEMLNELKNNHLAKWYPLAIDYEQGGYFTNITHDWKLLPAQEKMIVSQARHMWTTAKAAKFFDDEKFLEYSRHGFNFITKKMWDDKYGGYFQIRSRAGEISEIEGWLDEKRTYGNAFALYGLSALYDLTRSDDVLRFTIKSFEWIEEHAFDPKHKGYFQFLTREGKPFGQNDNYKTKASDAIEAGYKDQNSSIHLLEAYTEFYNIWKNDRVYRQLHGLLTLIRDLIVNPKGYLHLFFTKDWRPVSFRNAPPEERAKNFRLDHVSFGHDYETAYLMLEASHALGIVNDVTTLRAAKRMIDHAIENGWDNNAGGFFDEGYYFDENGKCEIIKDTKNWWAQAEALNALLLFSKIFPEEKKYFELFVAQWNYVKRFIIDNEFGGWFWGSLEKEPFYKTGQKGSIWKATYHDGRALMNCIKMLSDQKSDLFISSGSLRKLKQESDRFINHWRSIGKSL